LVKGRLKQNLSFWSNTLKANKTILDVIDKGYKIPFIDTPKENFFKNNRSAINNYEFVSKTITEMVKSGTVKETSIPPKVVIPLSVAENSSGKKRFILDLTYVNDFLYKDKIRFDDWKCFENYLKGDQGFLFKFDLKSGYYHIDIFEPHQTYLGFSWNFEGKTRYFIFSVLPFGLSTAPFIFTKTVRPLIKYWRSLAIKIACFLDDGLGTEPNKEKAINSSRIVYETLIKAGFVPNAQKNYLGTN